MHCLEWEACCLRNLPNIRARGRAALRCCGSTLAGGRASSLCTGGEGLSVEGLSVDGLSVERFSVEGFSVEGLPCTRPGNGAASALALCGQGLPSLTELMLYCPKPTCTASV